MTANVSKRRQLGKVCANCTITVSPVWRHAKGIDLTLCNACHICWVTKGVHRPVPPPEVLAKIVAAATKKAEPAACLAKSQDASASRSGSSSDTDLVGGKRKRVAKKWGTDIDTYGEGSIGRADSGESVDIEIIISSNASLYDQTPAPYRMNVYDAAKVIVALKKAKLSKTEPEQASPSKFDSEQCTRLTRKGSAKKDCSVTLTVEGRRKRIPKAFEPFKPTEQKRCQNCGVTETPVWRKAGGQYPLCNACGVSKRAHGVDRKPPSQLETALDLEEVAVDIEQTPPELDCSSTVDSATHTNTPLFLPVPQARSSQSAFLPDYCPLRVASPTVRCAPPAPVVGAEKVGMRRNLFGLAMKRWPSGDSAAPEEGMEAALHYP